MRPELVVRRIVHGMGYRYRLHCPELPGKPDLVFPRLGKIIDVRGCFWHQHRSCVDSHIPKSRTEYWKPKLNRNKKRDTQNLAKLRKLGWEVLIIWECAAEDSDELSKRLQVFLSR